MTGSETSTASRDETPYLAGGGGDGGLRLHCQLASQHFGVELVEDVLHVIGQDPELSKPEFDRGSCNLLILGVVEHFTNIEELGLPLFELRMNVFLAGKGEEIRGGQLIKQHLKGGRKKELSNNLHGWSEL
ncbi:unnamed protein product, partial [Vitis vinifera]